MTDPRVFKQKMEEAGKRFEKGVPEPLPQNWQAVARAMYCELDGEIGKMLTLRYGLHWAISLNDRDLFYRVLSKMEEFGYDRPE